MPHNAILLKRNKPTLLRTLSAGLVFFLAIQDFSFAYPEPVRTQTPRLYLIEDAHLNTSAQLDIAKKIDGLIDREKIRWVFLEGGSSDDSLSFLRKLAPLAKRKNVANSFLNKGYIQGPDYLDLTSDKTFSLWGVEQDKLYWKSVELYRLLKNQRVSMGHYLDSLDRTAESLRHKIYSPDLLIFDNRRRAYDEMGVEATDYFEFLWREAERLGVADSSFKAFRRLSKMRHVRYSHYEKAARALNPERLLSEKEALEALCVEVLAKSPEEKRLFETIRMLGVYRKLLSLKLDPQDYARLRHAKERFDIAHLAGFLNRLILETESHYENTVFLNPDFNAMFKDAQNFYALTLARDRHFLKNTLAKMREHNQSGAVLVAGGFHSRHLAQLAASRGIDLRVIRPNVSRESDTDKYEQILLSQVPGFLAVRPAGQMAARLADGSLAPVRQLLENELRLPGDRGTDILRDGGQDLSLEGARLSENPLSIVSAAYDDLQSVPIGAGKPSSSIRELIMLLIEAAAKEVLELSRASRLNYDSSDLLRITVEWQQGVLRLVIVQFFGPPTSMLDPTQFFVEMTSRAFGGTLMKEAYVEAAPGISAHRRLPNAQRARLTLSLPFHLNGWQPDFKNQKVLRWIPAEKKDEMIRLKASLNRLEGPNFKSGEPILIENWEQMKKRMILLAFALKGSIMQGAAALRLNRKTVKTALESYGIRGEEMNKDRAAELFLAEFGHEPSALTAKDIVPLWDLKYAAAQQALVFLGHRIKVAEILGINIKTVYNLLKPVPGTEVKLALPTSKFLVRGLDQSTAQAIEKAAQSKPTLETWTDEEILQAGRQADLRTEAGLTMALALFSEAAQRAARDTRLNQKFVRSFIGEAPADGKSWALPNEKQIQAATLLMGNRQVVAMYPAEGKTLAVVLGAYLKVLQGQKVEVHDWNTDLAFRDAQVAGAVLGRLGLRVSVYRDGQLYRFSPKPTSDLPWAPHVQFCADAARELREADIVYGYYDDLIFLRSHNDFEIGHEQRIHASALPERWVMVEEADTPLIDEISEPRVIGYYAGPMPPAKRKAYEIINSEAQNIIEQKAYKKSGRRTVQLLLGDNEQIEAKGRELIGEIRKKAGLTDSDLAKDVEFVLFLLRVAVEAKIFYSEGRDYLISDYMGKKSVFLRNENTGEISTSKRLRFYHVFFQLNENLAVIEDESISRRAMTTHYFYSRIAEKSGMSAVVGVLNADGEKLLRDLYGANVALLEPFHPDRKVKIPTRHVWAEEEMLDHVVAQTGKIHATGRPILINASSPREADAIYDRIKRAGYLRLTGDLKKITGRNPLRETNLWQKIGEAGSITVAAQTIGRGYEIKLAPALYEPVTLQIGNQTFEIAGLHVESTHYGRSISEGEQAKNRGGRRGRRGSYHVTAFIKDNPFLKEFAPEELERYTALVEKYGFDPADEIIPLLFELARKRRFKEILHQQKILEAQYRKLIEFQYRFVSAARKLGAGQQDLLKKADETCSLFVEAICKAIDRKDETLYSLFMAEFEDEILHWEAKLASGTQAPSYAGARLIGEAPLVRFQHFHLHWFSGGFLNNPWLEKGYDHKVSGDRVYDLLLFAGVQAKLQAVMPEYLFEGIYFATLHKPTTHDDISIQYGDVVQLTQMILSEKPGDRDRYLLSVSLNNWKEKNKAYKDKPEGRIVFTVRRRQEPLNVRASKLPKNKWIRKRAPAAQRGGQSPARRVPPERMSTNFEIRMPSAVLAAGQWIAGVQDAGLVDQTTKLILASIISQRVAPDSELVALEEMVYGAPLKRGDKLIVEARANFERAEKLNGKPLVPVQVEVFRRLDVRTLLDEAAKIEAWQRDRADEERLGRKTKNSDEQYFSALRDLEAEYDMLGTIAGKRPQEMVFRARLWERHLDFPEGARLAWLGKTLESDGWDAEPLLIKPSPLKAKYYQDIGADLEAKADLFELIDARLDRWRRILAVDKDNGKNEPDGLEMDDLIGYVYQPLVQLYLEHPFDIDRFHKHYYDLGTVKKMIRLSKRTLNCLRREHANALAGHKEERAERLEECISDVYKILRYYVIYASIINQLSQARNYVASHIQEYAGKPFWYGKMYEDSREALIDLIGEIHRCGKGLFSRTYLTVNGDTDEDVKKTVVQRVDDYFAYLEETRQEVIKKTPVPDLRGITRRKLAHYVAITTTTFAVAGLLWGLFLTHIPITPWSLFSAFLGIFTATGLYFWVSDSGHSVQNQYKKRIAQLENFKASLSDDANIPDIESTEFNLRVFKRQIAHLGRVEEKALKKRPTDFLFVLSPLGKDKDLYTKNLEVAVAVHPALKSGTLKAIFIPHDDSLGSDLAHRKAYRWIDYDDSFAEVMLKLIKDPAVLAANPFLSQLIQRSRQSKPLEELQLTDIDRNHPFFHGKSRAKFHDLRGGVVFAAGSAEQRSRILNREAALGRRSYLDLSINEVMEMNLLAQEKGWSGVVHSNANKARIGYLTLTGADMEFQAVRASSEAVTQQRYTSLILDQDSIVKGMNEKGTNALELYKDHRFNVSGELNGGFRTIEKHNSNVRQIFVMPGLYWRKISRPMLDAFKNIDAVMALPGFHDYKGVLAATSSEIQEMVRLRRVKTTTRINVQPHVEWSAHGQGAAESYLGHFGDQINQIADNDSNENLSPAKRLEIKKGVDAFTAALKDAWRRAYEGYNPPPVLGHAGTSFDIYAKSGLIELLKERGVWTEPVGSAQAARLADSKGIVAARRAYQALVREVLSAIRRKQDQTLSLNRLPDAQNRIIAAIIQAKIEAGQKTTADDLANRVIYIHNQADPKRKVKIDKARLIERARLIMPKSIELSDFKELWHETTRSGELPTSGVPKNRLTDSRYGLDSSDGMSSSQGARLVGYAQSPNGDKLHQFFQALAHDRVVNEGPSLVLPMEVAKNRITFFVVSTRGRQFAAIERSGASFVVHDVKVTNYSSDTLRRLDQNLTEKIDRQLMPISGHISEPPVVYFDIDYLKAYPPNMFLSAWESFVGHFKKKFPEGTVFQLGSISGDNQRLSLALHHPAITYLGFRGGSFTTVLSADSSEAVKQGRKRFIRVFSIDSHLRTGSSGGYRLPLRALGAQEVPATGAITSMIEALCRADLELSTDIQALAAAWQTLSGSRLSPSMLRRVISGAISGTLLFRLAFAPLATSPDEAMRAYFLSRQVQIAA